MSMTNLRNALAKAAARSVAAAPVLSFSEESWKGLDRYNLPRDLSTGYVVQADNLSVEGSVDGAGGQFVTRPGKQGVWTAVTGGGAPLYGLTPVVQSDGSSHLWFGQGTGVKRWDGVSSAPSAVSGLASLTASSLRLLHIAGYVYMADGTADLQRVLADGSLDATGAAAVTGLTRPNTPSNAGLSSLDFLTSPGSGGNLSLWLSDGWPGTDAITAPQPVSTDFDVLNGGTGTGSSFWVWKDQAGLTTGADQYYETMGNGHNGVELNSVGDQIETRSAFVLPTATQNVGGGSAPVAQVLKMSVWCDSRSESGIGPGDPADRVKFAAEMDLYANTGGTGSPFGTLSYPIGVVSTPGRLWEYWFDLRDYGALSSRFRLKTLQDYNGNPGFTDISLAVQGQQWGKTGGTASELILLRGSVACATMGDRYTSPLFDVGENFPESPTLLCRKTEVEYTFASTQDLSKTQRLLVPVTLLTGLSTAELRYKIWIRETGGTQLLSDEFSVTPGSTTQSSFDLTKFASADIDAVKYIGIVFTTDLDLAEDLNGDGGNTQILSIGSITKPGNLTPGIPVRYRVVEMDDATDPSGKLFNVIYSDGSNPSSDITPTLTQAVGVVTLGARVNAAADYFALYRFGDFPAEQGGNYGYLVGLFPWNTTDLAYGADTAKGTAPYYAAPANPYVSIDKPGTTGIAGTILYDNTPSSFLLYAQLYEPGREAPPKTIRDMVEWDGRLWTLGGTGRRSELHGSWLLSADANAGLYFTHTAPLNDPAAVKHGFYTHVGTEGADRAIRLIATDSGLAIMMERGAPWYLVNNGDSYRLVRYKMEGDGLNLSAWNAVAIMGGQVVYLTPNGLVKLSLQSSGDPLLSTLARDGNGLLSLPIAGDLTPGIINSASGGTALNATGYASCSLWLAQGDLFLSAPVSSDTVCSVIYRHDPNQNAGAGAWTRWLQGNVTGGVAVNGALDTNSHFVAGLDGMLYRYVPNAGDKATSGAAETGISYTLKTRTFTGQQNRMVLYSQWLELALDNGAETTPSVTLGITGDVTGAAWSQAYSLPAGGGSTRISLRPQRVRGRGLFATVSGTATRRVTLAALLLKAAVGSERLG